MKVKQIHRGSAYAHMHFRASNFRWQQIKSWQHIIGLLYYRFYLKFHHPLAKILEYVCIDPKVATNAILAITL